LHRLVRKPISPAGVGALHLFAKALSYFCAAASAAAFAAFAVAFAAAFAAFSAAWSAMYLSLSTSASSRIPVE